MTHVTDPADMQEIVGPVTYHYGFEQGSDAWHKARRGILTSSTIGKLVTPASMKRASNDKTRAIFYQMIADRCADVPHDDFVSYAMRRGKEDEIYARQVYSETFDPVRECGFVSRDDLGFPLGCSPDGLVGDDGQIEIKSRTTGKQVEAILSHLIRGEVPPDDRMQVHGGLMATGRKWCDYIVYSGGMKMPAIRVYLDPEIEAALLDAGRGLEKSLKFGIATYKGFVSTFPDTEYRAYDEEIEA